MTVDPVAKKVAVVEYTLKTDATVAMEDDEIED